MVLAPEWAACTLLVLLWLGSSQESIGGVIQWKNSARGKMQQGVVLTCFVCLWLSMGGAWSSGTEAEYMTPQKHSMGVGEW